MTENEAKISTIAEDYKTVLHEAKSMGCNDIRALYHIPIKNMELIVQALEEIQQYRAIGTVEECREAIENRSQRAVYDVDAVVEQLDELTGEECTLHECGIRSERCKPCIAKKAIEIVKGGGTKEVD